MAIETERKFLVKNDDFLPASVGHARIAQGYLSTDPARTVRVRIKGEKGFLTIKGASDPSGVSRSEWEYGIPVEDARELLALCGERIIDKTRYDVPVGSGHCWQQTASGGTTIGTRGALNAARVICLSACELYTRPETLECIRSEFLERRGPDFRFEPLMGDRHPPFDYNDN